jgi:lysophospholipase L1-like esterase
MNMLGKILSVTLAVCGGVVLLCTDNDNPQDSSPLPLAIGVRALDSVVVRDTFSVSVDTTGAGSGVLRFCWQREDSWTVDTTIAPSYKTVWQFPDTGTMRIIVHAFDTTDRRRQSENDTISVKVKAYIPRVVLNAARFSYVNDSVTVRASGTDSDGTIARYEWRLDAKTIFLATAPDSLLTLHWTVADTGRHVVYAVCYDNDGLRSMADSAVIQVIGSIPACTLVGDTSRSINDTATFTCTGTDGDGVITGYQWSIGRGLAGWFASPSGIVNKVWQLGDTGVQTVRVRVIDDDGYVSQAESLQVHVYAKPPMVTLKVLLIASAGDTATFTARASDGDGRIVRYDWSIGVDSGMVKFTGTDSIFRFVWSEADTGFRNVSVSVEDNDSLFSLPAIYQVRVRSGRPVLAPFADDTISSLDTLEVVRTLIDTTLRVMMYYWDTSGGAWDDSSASSKRLVYYTGINPVRLRCGVRDGKGNLFSDTVVIRFNRPPVIDAVSLVNSDTLWMGENDVPGTLPLRCGVSDPDGDSLTVTLVWRADTVAGNVPSTLKVDSVGVYPWSITVRDPKGHLARRSGTMVIGREHTVCFAGHSIIAGVGGDGIGGGFRAGVLAGLRDSLGRLERVRTVGPLVSGLMTGAPKSDSCLAISGATAREMQLLLDNAYQKLTADIWVLMLGVNGGFSSTEMQSTAAMINRMFTRNPKARLYTLLSPPFSGISLVQRRYYNNNIRDTVSGDTVRSWAARGYAANVIRSDSILAVDQYTAIDSLFADDPALHPNQLGYDILRKEILQVMWSGKTRVLPLRKE